MSDLGFIDIDSLLDQPSENTVLYDPPPLRFNIPFPPISPDEPSLMNATVLFRFTDPFGVKVVKLDKLRMLSMEILPELLERETAPRPGNKELIPAKIVSGFPPRDTFPTLKLPGWL